MSNYEIPQYWPNSLKSNNSDWTYGIALDNPRLEIKKNKDKYILKISTLEIHLGEKELVDWIVKFEMSMTKE